MNFSKFIKYGFLIFGGLVLIGFLLKGKIIHEKFDSDKWKNWEETGNGMVFTLGDDE